MTPALRRAADVALSVAGFAVCLVGVTLALFCLVVDAPDGYAQTAALDALWSTVVDALTPGVR